MKLILLLGRILFSAIFIMASFNHFTPSAAAYAAAQGVPLSEVLVPISGVLALVGGLSVLFGYKARFGALLLLLFLVPVTFMMHNFWVFTDPMVRNLQQIMFLKNLSLVGGALIITYFGAGPMSLDHH